MKKLNNFLNKVGIDKALHFAVGGWIVSILSPFGIGAMGIAFIIMLILSVIKEKLLDEQVDIYDIVAAFIGGFISFILYIPVDILLY